MREIPVLFISVVSWKSIVKYHFFASCNPWVLGYCFTTQSQPNEPLSGRQGRISILE